MSDQYHPLRITLVVLGELSRSPRMMYHGATMARLPAEVSVVAYAGGGDEAALAAGAGVRLYPIPAPPLAGRGSLPRPVFLLASAWRLLSQSARLAWTLLARVPPADFLVVQNPPAIPTLAIARMVARLRGARLVVDWHNFGFSMLAPRLGAEHPVVRWAERYERAMARGADAHLCVSRTMQRRLEDDWKLGGVRVLYDRPEERFQPRTGIDRSRLLADLQRVGVPSSRDAGEVAGEAETSVLLVSPTSWTADEDFPLLIEAMTLCEATIREREQRVGRRCFPDFVVAITGRGPLRESCEKEIRRRRFGRFEVRTGWLDRDPYAALLAAADLGLCLHRSTSGADLPMKVLDMFGSGLPVCAYDYGPCLGELVRDRDNGRLFSTAGELASILGDLFEDWPARLPELARLRDGARAAAAIRWEEGWRAEAGPLFLEENRRR